MKTISILLFSSFLFLTSLYGMTEKKELTQEERIRKKQEADREYDWQIEQLQAAGATQCNMFYFFALEEYFSKIRNLGYDIKNFNGKDDSK